MSRIAELGLEGRTMQQVFGFAGEPDTCAFCRRDPRVELSFTPFTREDVAKVLFRVDGETNNHEWRIGGRLIDGDWFYILAGRGASWSARRWGYATRAATLEELRPHVPPIDFRHFEEGK